MTDASFFIYSNNGNVILFLVYVNAPIVTCNKNQEIHIFVAFLSKSYSMDDLGSF